MPFQLGDVANPLASIEPARPSTRNGNLISINDDLDAYRYSIRQMQLARSWRVFTRSPAAAFRMITDKEEALRLLKTMDEQQAVRNQLLGRTELHEEAHAKFYRGLLESGIADGSVVMSALTNGEELVAVSLGLRKRDYYVVLRISNAGEQWSKCSPGRLILDQTIAALHKEGVRHFDLGPGNDELKRRFGAVAVPLADIKETLTLRGHLLIGATNWLGAHPRLKRLLKKVLCQVAV